jgi:hypothetical protein
VNRAALAACVCLATACADAAPDDDNAGGSTGAGFVDAGPFTPAPGVDAAAGGGGAGPAPVVDAAVAMDGTRPAVPDDAGAVAAPDAGEAPVERDAAPALPPPAAVPPAPPPDGSEVVFAVAAERPDWVANACTSRGGTHDFLFEVVRRLRARDPRWGLVVRDGAMLDDRIAYFHGDGPAEGSRAIYVLDVIGRNCGQPGVDEPPAPGWLDDSAAGGTFTLAPLDGEAPPPQPPDPVDAGPGPAPMLPLPDERATVEALAAEHPDWLENSCVAAGGDNMFLFELVRRLRARDPRWGLNWKRGNVGDMSQDVVDYFWAEGDPEGRTEVYIIDVIGDHCGAARPAFTDVTEATREGGTIGRWTLQPLPQ